MGSCSVTQQPFLIVRQVLDEADRLLTPTFADELRYLFDALPKERQTALFTATFTPSIESVANAPPRPGKQKPFIHKMTATYVDALWLAIERYLYFIVSRQ